MGEIVLWERIDGSLSYMIAFMFIDDAVMKHANQKKLVSQRWMQLKSVTVKKITQHNA